MTEADTAAYLAQVAEGNFTGMRRVSFLQDDLTASGKALRLAELCGMLCEEGRKAVVYSYFRETVKKASANWPWLVVGGAAILVIAGVIVWKILTSKKDQRKE